MPNLYKNIVYDGATLIAGGNIHIGDVIYHIAEDFHHSILFLRIERSGQTFSAQLSVKSKHGRAGNLGNSGEPLLREKIALDIPEQLFRQVDELQATRRGMGDSLRNTGTQSAQSVQEQEEQLSQAIFTIFFSGDIGTVCRDFIQLLEKRKVTELLLAISTDDERVKNLPWEMAIPHLFPANDGAEKRSLAVGNFGIVRTLETSLAAFDMQGKTGSAAPLKMLFVTALPENLPERDKLLEIEKEQEKLIHAVGRLEATGDSRPKIVIEFLDNASLGAIQEALAARCHDILHISGHGAYLPDLQGGVLFMEDEWGDEQRISGATLGGVLRQHQSLRLVILSACETAVCGEGSVVEQLARASGVPAILAMRFAISDPAAVRFTSVLYERLSKGETLSCSVAHAREALWQEAEARRAGEPPLPYPAEWFTPSLWLNQYVGALADLQQAYRLPGDFYPHSSILRSRRTRLLGEGFIGRKRHLIQLRRLFAKGKYVCLHGLGGLGKTTLAEAFAHSYENRIHEVLIFRGSPQINEKTILDELFARFCEAQPPDALRRQLQYQLENPQLEPTAKLQLLLDNYPAGRKPIFLFDNFEDLLVLPDPSPAAAGGNAEPKPGSTKHSIRSEGLKAFLLYFCDNAPSNSRLLFTSRYPIAGLPGAVEHLPLGKLGYAEQYRLVNFSTHLRNIPMAQREAVYRRLDGHPRAYEFLETLLAKDPHFDFATLDASVGEVEAKVFEDLLLEKIWQCLTADEQEVFRVASIFIARAPVAALSAVSGKAEAELLPVLRSLHDWSVCFLEEDGVFEVHRLTREWVVLKYVSDEESKKWSFMAAEFYFEFLDDSYNENLFGNLVHVHERIASKKEVRIEDALLAYRYYRNAEAWKQYGELTTVLFSILQTWGNLGLALQLNLEVLSFPVSEHIQSITNYHAGLLFKELGEINNALVQFDKAQKIFSKNNNPEGVAAVLVQIGSIKHLQGENEDAISCLLKAKEIYEKCNNKAGLASVLNEIGAFYLERGKSKEAYSFVFQCLQLSEELSDEIGAASALVNLAAILSTWGKYDDALDLLEKAKDNFERHNSLGGMANVAHQMGVLYFQRKKHDDALIHFKDALKISEQMGDIAGIGSASGMMGGIYYEMGDMMLARTYSLKAKGCYEQLRAVNETAGIIRQLGMICQREGNMDTAWQYYEEALRMFEANENKRGIAMMLNQIGNVHFQNKSFENALNFHQRSIEIAIEITLNDFVAKALYQIGLDYEGLGNESQSLSHFLEAIPMFLKQDDKLNLAFCMEKAGLIFKARKDYSKAIFYLAGALSAFKESGFFEGGRLVYENIEEIKTLIGEANFQAIAKEIQKAENDLH